VRWTGWKPQRSSSAARRTRACRSATGPVSRGVTCRARIRSVEDGLEEPAPVRRRRDLGPRARPPAGAGRRGRADRLERLGGRDDQPCPPAQHHHDPPGAGHRGRPRTTRRRRSGSSTARSGVSVSRPGLHQRQDPPDARRTGNQGGDPAEEGRDRGPQAQGLRRRAPAQAGHRDLPGPAHRRDERPGHATRRMCPVLDLALGTLPEAAAPGS
jgi:hypothetical protein